MVTAIRQLYANITTAADNIANIQIVRKGIITSIYGSTRINSVTDDGSAIAELSFFPSIQNTTNDAAGPLMTLQAAVNLSTNGAFLGAVNVAHTGLSIPVEPGMRLYVNGTVANATAPTLFLVAITA